MAGPLFTRLPAMDEAGVWDAKIIAMRLVPFPGETVDFIGIGMAVLRHLNNPGEVRIIWLNEEERQFMRIIHSAASRIRPITIE